MKSYLLTISLGPVQEFIAAARKTRDLWYGSDLLSQVSRVAARAVQEAGASLIFPAPQALNAGHDDVPVANKIVAIVPADLDPANVATRAREAAQKYLSDERDAALKRAGGLRHLIDEALLNQQLDAFLETYCAWQPYDAEQTGAYAKAREDVEALLAGRKALRDFRPAVGRDGVPKSSLDGGRETVLRESPADWQRLGIKPNEQLDGISLIKRLAPSRRFVSVSRVAIDPLLRHFHSDPRLKQLKDLARQLDGSDLVEQIHIGADELPQYAAFPFDTDLFYGPPPSDEALDPTVRAQAERFARIVREMAGDVHIPEPPAYLAVLVADGDRMGQILSSMTDAEQHRRFSAASSDFARQAREVVARHQGALVYSGGDDVLALLPLDQALDCARAVVAAFTTALAPLELSRQPTMSVGLAIGHYHEDLQDLLGWAREAEKRAKDERNALAVTLHTRSGGDAVAVCQSWDQQPLERWHRWVEWYRRDALPDGAAYELRKLARELRALADAGQRDVAARLVAPETERIVKRKKGQRGREPLADGEIAAIKADLRGDDATVLDRLETMVNEMIVARRIAQACDAALGPLVTKEGDAGDS